MFRTVKGDSTEFRIQCTSVKSSLFAGNRNKINTRFLAEIKYHIKNDSTLLNSAPHIRVDVCSCNIRTVYVPPMNWISSKLLQYECTIYIPSCLNPTIAFEHNISCVKEFFVRGELLENFDSFPTLSATSKRTRSRIMAQVCQRTVSTQDIIVQNHSLPY